MSDLVLLRRRWKDQLATLLDRAKGSILMSSPFVTHEGVNFVSKHVSESIRAEGEVSLLTNLSPSNVVQGATSPEALQSLGAEVGTAKFYHLPQLHAKVYVGDTDSAIVTSGNLTAGGLHRNYEYGLCISDQPAVERVRRDIDQYAGLGASIDADQLSAYCQAAEEAQSAFQKQQRTASRSAQRHFKETLQKANDELIRLRLAEGPITRVFEKTVLYLLRREGPLSTREIHPQIQQIHPDLCNDGVDRVINGERFGRKWKHSVRTAQQHLKKRGRIELVDGSWRLCH